MALASFSRVKKRVIQLLGANNSDYVDYVDGQMGAFPYDQELIDAALEADAQLVTEAYFPHPTLSTSFYTTVSGLANGAALPGFLGRTGKVELKNAGGVWELGTEAQSIDDINNLIRYGASYLGAGNYEGMYKLDGSGYIYHTSNEARVAYPVYTKTSALQSLDMHESALIAGTLMMLYKFGSPFHSEAGAQFYMQFFENQKQKIALNHDLDEVPAMQGGNG